MHTKIILYFFCFYFSILHSAHSKQQCFQNHSAARIACWKALHFKYLVKHLNFEENKERERLEKIEEGIIDNMHRWHTIQKQTLIGILGQQYIQNGSIINPQSFQPDFNDDIQNSYDGAQTTKTF